MKLIEKHTDQHTGNVTETFLLDNGHTAQYVTPKDGERKFSVSSDPDYVEPKPKKKAR